MHIYNKNSRNVLGTWAKEVLQTEQMNKGIITNTEEPKAWMEKDDKNRQEEEWQSQP